MRDMSVLNRAGHLTGQPVYGFGDDAKDYYNQLVMASSERHKLNIVFLARDGEPVGSGQLLFVSEKRLGFGTHGASNIAQRFSDALLDLFREQMDEADAEARSTAPPAEQEWLQSRLDLQRRRGEPCLPIRRWTTAPADRQPEISAPLRVAEHTERLRLPPAPPILSLYVH